jgi:hypothetical protein
VTARKGASKAKVPKPPAKTNAERQRAWKARQKAAMADALAVAQHLITVRGWKRPTDEELLDPALVRVRLARAYDLALAGFPGVDPHAIVSVGRAYAALVGAEAAKKVEHSAKGLGPQAPNVPPPWLNEAPTEPTTEKH